MSIANDWNFDYAAKVISHIDGILTYDGGSGTQPTVGSMIIADNGAIGKILARTGNEVAGTFTLTNVIGRFKNNAVLDQLSYVDFDGVGNGGFKVGDTIKDQVTGSMIVKFIEYNIDGVVGHGRAFGTVFTAFTNDSVIDIDGGQTAVAVADGTGSDKDAAFDALVDGSLAVTGTPDTNNCIIIHYDNGTIAIPEDAHIKSGAAGAEGYAQKVIGSTAIGSVRVIDSDTTGGAWANNAALRILNCVYYDALVAGKVFSAGDVIKAVAGASPDAVGRVLAVIDDLDNTGKLILAGMSGTWDNDNEIHVKQPDDTYVKYGEVENSQDAFLDAALINIPAGVRNEQREDQGGIYAAGSLNIVRSANALYTYAQDLFDELSALDDDPPLDGNVKDQLYTVLNNYIIPDLSLRFVEKGSFKDSGNNNIFTNITTGGAIADIGNHGFFYDSVNPTPQPDMYIEQDETVRRQDWLEGNLDMLLKVKTNTDPAYINPSVAALGQLINGAAFTVHLRPYGRTYDSNEVTKQGGIAVVSLGNAKDLNNTTGQYSAAYTGGASMPFTAGETITTPDGKRGLIVSSTSGATGTVTYILKSSANFVNTDVITGAVSGASATLAEPANLTAGYGTDIRVMTVDMTVSGGTTTGVFAIGENVTQAVTGATAWILRDYGGTLYLQKNNATAFSGNNAIVGDITGASNAGTLSYDTNIAAFPADIGGGVGDKNYTANVSANITNANKRTVAAVYEWWKFILSAESILLQGGAGSTSGKEGRMFRKLQSNFAEVRGDSQYGKKAGTLVIGAQGVFIQKETLDPADVRNIQLIDNLGATYNPPNLQSLSVVNIWAGVRVAVYRSTGAGLETILRNEFKVGTVGGGNNEAADYTILVAANVRTVSPLPYDVPDVGVLRILDPNDTGNYLRFPYTSVDRTTNIFTMGVTIGSITGGVALTLNDNVHVVFIEQEASGVSVTNTIQYIEETIPLYAIARIKGKKPFKTPAAFGGGGANIGAVLSADEVVNLP